MVVGLFVTGCASGSRDAGEFKLLYSQDFSDPAEVKKDFAFTDPNAWRLGQSDDGQAHLEQHTKSKYKYPHRSPFNIGLIDGYRFGTFIMEAEVQQTSREYGHRDVCLFFSFNDPSHFYYNHIATKADDHANNVFIVDDAPRTKIAVKTTPGYDWSTRDWHKVRIVRDIDSGYYAVYMNDSEEAEMIATDLEMGWGHIGFGTFDDSMRVRNIKVWGVESRAGHALFFEKMK
jgi:hypothetical protein